MCKLDIVNCLKQWLASTFKNYFKIWGYILAFTAVCIIPICALIFSSMMIVTNDFLVAGVIITGLISIPVLLIVFGRMMLRIARSEAVKFKDCLSFGFKNGMWWKAIVFFITYLFGIMAGMLLFVVPGIYLFISWCAALYLLCDGKAGPIESLKQSRQLVTKAGFFRVIGYILLASLIMAALYIPFIIFPGYELLAATIQFLLIPANTMLPITLYLSITDQHPDQGETRS